MLSKHKLSTTVKNVFSPLLYDLENWAPEQIDLNNFAAFELTNQNERNFEYLGHIMKAQKYTLSQPIVHGKIRYRKSEGRYL